MGYFFGVYDPFNSRELLNINETTSLFSSSEYFELDTYRSKSLFATCQEIIPIKRSESKFGIYIDDKHGCIIVGIARLYHKDELFDKIGINIIDEKNVHDLEIILKAYLKWGYSCVRRLDGDFAFLIYDRNKELVYFARQPCGYSSFFYREINGLLFFSSDSKLLTELDCAINIFDSKYFGSLQSIGVMPISFLTLIKGLFSLENGFYILWQNIKTYKKVQFWRLEKRNLIKHKHNEDLYHDFRSYLSRSVRERLDRYNNGIFLSSGLDSMAIAFFALYELKYYSQNLTSFTSIPDLKYRINNVKIENVDESILVKLFSENKCNLITNYLSFPDLRLINVLEYKHLVNPYFPFPNLNTGWIQETLKFAASKNICHVLNAQAGNFTISYTSRQIYLELFFQLKFRKLLRLIRLYASNRNVNIIRAIKTILFDTFLLHVKHISSVLFKFKIRKGDSILRNYSANSFFFSFDSKKVFDWDKTIFFSSRKLREKQLSLMFDFVSNRWFSEMSISGVFCSDPTMDLRLVEFMFNLPNYVYIECGLDKGLYKKSMNGLLPDEILFNTSYKVQSYDFQFRFLSEEEFYILMNNLKQNEFNSIINFDLLVKSYNNIVGINESYEKNKLIADFMRKISFLIFISQTKNLTFD